MTTVDPHVRDKIASQLSAAIRAAEPTGGLRGTEAARLVRTAFAALDPPAAFDPQVFGARSLKEVVQQLVPGVQIVARAGVDVVYALRDGHPTTATSSVRRDEGVPLAWKAWVSPASEYGLEIRASGDVSVVPREAALAPGCILIAPASNEEHRMLAGEFLVSQQASQSAELKAQLEETLRGGHGWWWAWMRRMRATPSLNAAWLAFRRDRLQALLRSKLSEAVLTPDAQSRAFAIIVASRRSSPAAPIRDEGHDSGAMRRAAHAAVERLSEGELRQLLLPLGLVYDALKARA